jgi:hypothetical protein
VFLEGVTPVVELQVMADRGLPLGAGGVELRAAVGSSSGVSDSKLT